MKSKIITFLILIFAFVGFNFKSVNAQYVTIPDANFATWLQSYFPMCMNGNQMDTTCSEIVNTTTLTIHIGAQVNSIYGLNYFDNLEDLTLNITLQVLPPLPKTLKNLFLEIYGLTSIASFPDSLILFGCTNANLVTLPTLPSTLEDLTCINSHLNVLPTLPNTLKILYCYNNELTSLPALPDSLLHLDCSYNQLTSLPVLPNRWLEIVCDNNNLTSLPVLTNTSVWAIYASNNNLTSLPELPNSLESLTCYNNQLTSLPNLPSSLIILTCSQNLLTTLPILPISLYFLHVSDNQLSNIQTLPNTLSQFSCGNNLLTQLPDLPNTLLTFYCNNNNISCLPILPPSLIDTNNFSFSNNPITCVPNYVAAMDSFELAFPLCMANDLVNNPNNCNAAFGLFGNIYDDANNNCALSTNEMGIKNIEVKFFNTLTNQFGITYSALSGVYSYPTIAGNYHVLIDTLNKPFKIDCMYPGNDTVVNSTVLNPFIDNLNFEVKCKDALDLKVQSVIQPNGMVFPGQLHTLRTLVGDASQWYGLNCGAGTSGEVQFTITGPVTYSGISNGALTPVINGTNYTYSIADFGTVNNATDFQLRFLTNTTAQLGDQICVHVEVSSDSLDINPLNNSYDFCYAVLNSYDPNYKEVYPKDVLPGYEDWLTYTIHFQNTGNAPAINIRLLDTLDSNLNAQTFEVINYSHFNTVTLMDGVLDFRFPNILLPDSTSDLAGSQGFVQYRIKPIANLPEGTQIQNTANIYFDYNAPITTNTTINNFTTTVGLKENNQIHNITIYPNPSNGIFNVSSTANIVVYNIVGELISSTKNAKTIDLTKEPNGIYFVKVNGMMTQKIVKN